MTSEPETTAGTIKAVDEVVDIVSKLIRFDTSNTGEPETTKGEEDCAKWVAGMLEEVGYTTQYVESGRPGRGNVFARLAGPPHSVHSGAPDAVLRRLRGLGTTLPMDLPRVIATAEDAVAVEWIDGVTAAPRILVTRPAL